MSHKSIRLLIRDTAERLSDDIQFYYARTSDFNLEPKKRGTMVVLDPLSSTPEYSSEGTYNYTKSWTCSMAFYQFDKEGSIPDEYALILDQTDGFVDKFIQYLNFYMDQSDEITISGITQTPFIKVTSAILTGHLLAFTILAPDSFDYCALEDEC